MFRNKSKKPTKDDKSLFQWANNLREDGQARRRVHEAQWWENIASYQGDLWSEFDLTLGQLMTPAKPDHRVRVPINLVQSTVRTEYAKLLKNRPMIDSLARSDEKTDLNSARVGDSLLNDYIEQDLSMPKHRRRMLQWVLICGLGGIFVDHDPKALGDEEVLVAPDGTPVTDPQVIKAIQRYYRDKHRAPKTMNIPMGELRHTALSPFQIIWDFSKLDYTEAKWMIISEVYDVDEVWRRWDVEVEGDSRDKPGVIERRMIEQWDITNRPNFQDNWSKGSAQKMTTVHRLFVLPGHRYFPQGTEVVFTDKELVDHTNYPWKHNMLPAGICGHIPTPWAQHTTSVVQQIKPVVLEISKTESQMIENRNLMGNPPWIEYAESRVDGEIENKPGLRITINYMPNVPEPHPVQMPEISQYIKDLIPILKDHVLEISGQSEVSQGKVPSGARAGVTIAYLQEEDDTKLGPTVQEYEEAIERVAWLQLQTIAQTYDIPRTVRIYKPHSDPEVFDFYGTMLAGIAGVRVQAGSALPRSKAAKQQFVLDLFDRGLEKDPRKIRDMLELSQGEPDEWEKDINQAERENRKAEQGIPIAAEEWHNHLAHHYQHRDEMKGADFEDWPPERQQALRDHDADHTRFEQAAQQQQMVNQALAAQGGGTPPTAPPQGSNGNTGSVPPEMQGQTPPPSTGPDSTAPASTSPQQSSGQAVAFGQPQ